MEEKNENEKEKWYEKIWRWVTGVLIIAGVFYGWFIDPFVQFKKGDGLSILVLIGVLIWLIVSIFSDKSNKKK